MIYGRDIVKIYAEDGKEFSGTNYEALVKERNAYEANQKLKKEKEEAERKTREEKQKKLLQYRSTRLKEINDDLFKVVDKIREYEKETGYKVIYAYDYSIDKTVVKDTPNNSIDLAWYGFVDDFFNKIHKK